MSNDRPSADTQPAGARKRRGLDGRMIGGRYRVTRTVAAGANTLIADAHDTQLDRQVTIKLVRPELSESEEFRRTFRKQMELMSEISHPNIAAVYDWGEERIGKRTTVYAVVEHLSGGSLRDLFDRRRTLTPSQALMVGLEACRGLDFAHRKGFVHTELTPSKLVFGDDRRLHIVDFGLARALGEQEWRDPARLATHVARYASPEQAEGKELDGKSDVYSLALILVEAVTGATPFVGDSTVATLSARVGKLMPVSADLGPLASVLERAGRPDPADRATASQFGRALVRAAERMPRPTPIPILSPNRLDDPAKMRRPDDPTGGMSRPAASPVPALVPPTGASPTDATSEITGPATRGARVAPTEPAAAAAAAAATSAAVAPGPDVAVEPAPDTIDPAAVGGPSANDAGPSASGASGAEPPSGRRVDTITVDPPAEGADVHDELAALVERTPQKPPPAGEHEPVVAGRGRKARRAARAARRAEAKTAKAEAKTAKAQAKVAARVARKQGRAAPVSAPAAIDAAPSSAPHRRRRRWVPALLMLLVLGVLGGIGYLAWVLLQTPKHEIPAVLGLPQDEALALVDDFKWEIDLDEGRSDEFPEPGAVMSVNPDVGEDLSEGSPLLLVVSQGPEYRQVPDLAGLPLPDAVAEIEALRLVAGEPTEEFSETMPAGSVISATVDGVGVGDNVLPGATLDIVVSAGPQQRRVPQLRGLTMEQATQLLGDLGLEIAAAEPVFDDDVPPEQIAAQSPAPDTNIDRGGTITVSPSKGPDLVTLPDMSGMTLPEIGQALEDSGLHLGPLVGVRSGVFYQAYLDGELLEAGAQVKRGSSISILIFPA